MTLPIRFCQSDTSHPWALRSGLPCHIVMQWTQVGSCSYAPQSCLRRGIRGRPRCCPGPGCRRSGPTYRSFASAARGNPPMELETGDGSRGLLKGEGNGHGGRTQAGQVRSGLLLGRSLGALRLSLRRSLTSRSCSRCFCMARNAGS